MSDPSERNYIAFISYRHNALDRQAAERVQKSIESYTVPADLREKCGGKRLGMCFRDEDELTASSSLTDSIYYALDHSKYLIVICTPDLPLSKWCEAEIKYFLKTHDREHILAVLADGTPDTSFSPWMLHEYDEGGNVTRDCEPLGANIAGPDHTINNKIFKKEMVRLYAAMLECPFDDLWQRQRRARTRNIMIAGAAALAVMAVFLGVVMNRNAQISAQNAQIQEQNEQITSQNDELTKKNDEIQKQNDQITEQNDQISAQNEEIEEKNSELQAQLSTALVDSGINKLENFDIYGALEDALAALDGDDPSAFDPRAEKLLSDALGAYKCGELQSVKVYEQTTDIIKLKVTDDGHFAILLDHVGTVRCLDLSDYSVVWEYLVKDTGAEIYTEGHEDRVLIKSAEALVCLSVEDGSVIWQYTHDSPNYFQCVSDDGSLFALLDTQTGDERYETDDPDHPSDYSYYRSIYLVFLDTVSGGEVSTVLLPENDETGFLTYYSDNFETKYFGSDFSDDGSKFLCVLPFTERVPDADANTTFDEYTEYIFIIDMKSGSLLYDQAPYGAIAAYDVPYNIILGADIDDSAQNAFVIQNDRNAQSLTVHSLRSAGDSYEHSSYDQNFYYGTDSLYMSTVVEKIHATAPLLSADAFLLCFTDKNIYIFDKSSGETVRGFTTDSNIISAGWTDVSKTAITVTTEKGSLIDLGITYNGSYDLTAMQYRQMEQTSAALYIALNGGFIENMADGGALVVQNTAKGSLICLGYASDPSAQIILQSDDSLTLDSEQIMADLLEGSDTGMLFLNGYTVIKFDRVSGELNGTAEMKSYFSHSQLGIIILDDDHFIQGSRLYSLKDGSVTSYTDSAPGSENMYDANINLNGRMENGDIITTGMEYNAYSDDDGESYRIAMMYDFWKNGVYQDTFEILDITEGDIPLPVIGRNGIIMVRGLGWIDKTPGDYIRFYNINSGLRTAIPPKYPDLQYISAMGNERSVGAVLYENGELELLFSYDDGKMISRSLSLNGTGRLSAQNEVFCMCFSPDDRYLITLSSAGRLQVIDLAPIYEAEREEKSSGTIYAFTEQIALFHDNIDELDNYISAEYSQDGKTIFIYAGYVNHAYNAILIDTESWEIKAEIPDAYIWDSENDRIYCYTENADGRGTSAIVTYKEHTLEDLKEWAQEVLDARP